MGYHAKLSPSSAKRWTSCTASIAAQEGLPNTNSAASMEGTCCHQLCAEVLQRFIDGAVDEDCDAYLGRRMLFWDHPESESNGEDWEETFVEPIDPNLMFTGEVVVTEAMIDACNSAVNFVREQVALTGGTLEVEQRVPIGWFTGEDGATGTCDVLLMTEETIWSMDFKFGRHKVFAYDTLEPARGALSPVQRILLQLGCYALGAFHKYELMYDFKFVRATIIQPFLGHISDYSCTIEELMLVKEFLREKADETRDNPVFVPSQDNCHFCKRSGDCRAQDEVVLAAAMDGFDDVRTEGFEDVGGDAVPRLSLADKYAKIELVTTWAKDVGERMWRALQSGQPQVRSDGLSYKFVEGRKGDRKWCDPGIAEARLAAMRLRKDQMFKMTVISPADVEKLAKAKKGGPPPLINKQQWEKLKDLITQAPAGKSIALETDARPNLPTSADGFDDVADDNSDLFGE